MKKIIIFAFFSAFIFSSNPSLAASYPATCPSVAQGILNAIVGGCSGIDRTTYSNIYDKCCVQAKVPAPVVAPAPAKTPVQQPPAEVSIPPSTDSSLEQVPAATVPLVEKNVEPTPVPQVKEEPRNILVRFFSWLFRRNK